MLIKRLGYNHYTLTGKSIEHFFQTIRLWIKLHHDLQCIKSILVLNPLAHPSHSMAISVKEERHRSHYGGNTSQNSQCIMRSEIAVHRNRSNSHRPRDHVTAESHETEGRRSVNLVHENDVEVRAGEDGNETVAEERGSDYGGPDAVVGLRCVVSNDIVASTMKKEGFLHNKSSPSRRVILAGRLSLPSWSSKDTPPASRASPQTWTSEIPSSSRSTPVVSREAQEDHQQSVLPIGCSSNPVISHTPLER